MPPRSRRTRLTERQPAATTIKADSDAKPNGIFHFVSVNPSSELQKSENRSVIRSHASKYIWRQHRAGRTDSSNPNSSAIKSIPSRRESLTSPTASNATAKERQWPLPPDTVENEAALSILSPPDEANTFPSENEDMADTGESLPGHENVGRNRDATSGTSYPSNMQSAQLSMEAAANMYEHENNTIAGPFSQLITFIGEPANQFPSMLGGSAISKLMRYAAFELWPGLVLGAGNQKWTQKDVAQSWLPRAMSHPALFTAFLYGAAGHLQTRKRLESAHVAPQTREEKLEQIVCETETVKQLNKMMLDPQHTCTDEVILAVLCMAFNRIDYSKWTSDLDPAPKAPLRNLQWLDVYGGLSLNDQHIKGLFALLHTRGGLDQLKLPGLAETLSTSAIMLSTKCLVKPRLPFVPIFKESATGKTPKWPSLSSNTCPMPVDMINLVSNIQPAFSSSPSSSSPPENNINNTTSSTTNTANNPTNIANPRDIFTKSNLPVALTTVLRNMQNYCVVVSLHCQGLLPYLELPVIADRRNWVQYELLSLKPIHEFNEYTEVTGTDAINNSSSGSGSGSNHHNSSIPVTQQQQHQQHQPYNYKIYESVRFAAMVYSMLVVFPLPAANRPFPRLCRMMKAALVAAEVENITPYNSNRNIHCWSGAPEMLLWVMILGTMAARNTPTEDWFVERTGDVIKVLGIRSWEQLKGKMEMIMWMDCVCDAGGLAVWNEAGGAGNWAESGGQAMSGNGFGIPIAERAWVY
ncbi:hypothetical protein AJ78_01282 [Emergomyces pasteurianus Ep9510]|uniref:Transcription factor domain-containing protein n=1 Tax=Emergomyces pasteurianus Ep9510 TaxID=1447872 RepID=A0A1J9PQN2_9EURO|nr:hypothetical protein AJ78_01282 [Emergomyces pasteurianus Ep9510]